MTYFDDLAREPPEERPSAQDPLLEIVLRSEGIAPGFRASPDDPRLFGCLLRIADDVSLEDLRTGRVLAGGTEAEALRREWETLIDVPRLFDALDDVTERLVGTRLFRTGGIVAAYVRLDFLALVRDTRDALRGRVEVIFVGAPIVPRIDDLTDDGPLLTPDDADRILAARGAGPARRVVAVVDDAIAFANERFRAGTKTRIRRYWAQTDDLHPNLPIFLGTRLDAAGIDGLIAGSIVGGEVDEAAVYRACGVLDFARPDRTALGLRATHGTAVMDVAAGRPQGGTGSDVSVVAVQLPRAAIADTSLERLQAFIVHAFAWIVYEALALALEDGTGPPDVVINLSFGDTAGPHDGTAALEIVMEFVTNILAPAMRVVFVLPSGNSHLSRGHASFRLPQGAADAATSLRLPWRIPPDDKTASLVQIWTPPVALPLVPRLQVRLLPPGGSAGDATAWHAEGVAGPPTLYGPPNAPLAGIGWSYWPPNGRGVFLVAVEPTAPFDVLPTGAPSRPNAPCGLWQVEVALVPHDASVSLPIEAYVERDDTPVSYRARGRQTYFDAACFERFEVSGQPLEADPGNCFVVREGCMNAIATGCSTIVVGALLGKEDRPSPYSAGGPVLTPPCAAGPARTGPDVVALADTSLVHRGVLAAGTYSGSVVAASGTSIAAPSVARRLEAVGRNSVAPDRPGIQGAAGPAGGDVARRGNGLVSTPALYVRRILP